MTSPLLTGPPPDTTLAHLWATVLDELSRDPAISTANFSTWLRETQLIERDDGAGAPGEAVDSGEFVVGAPHAFARDRLARTFRPAIEQALARCLRRPGIKVRFAISRRRALPSEAIGSEANGSVAVAPVVTALTVGARQTPSTADLPVRRGQALGARNTFERFVVGKGSEFAVAAARAVADNLALAYNPLYLYGDPGTGKTHLLQAIGHQVLAHRPTAQVVYIPTPGATWSDFESTRRPALFLLDDVQLATDQGALRAALATMHDAGAQIVVAGDRPPRELIGVEPQLRSWLQMGLVAGIGTPDFETRLALVRQRVDVLRVALPPAVLEVIARRAPANVRELEAVVTRVVAEADLSGGPLTPEHVGRLLEDVLGPAPLPTRRRATAEQILLAVASTFGVPVAALIGRRRDKEVVVPRQVAMYLMRHETGASLAEIGAELGGRDHSTVIHGCERIDDALGRDVRLREYVDAARQADHGPDGSGRAAAAHLRLIRAAMGSRGVAVLARSFAIDKVGYVVKVGTVGRAEASRRAAGRAAARAGRG